MLFNSNCWLSVTWILESQLTKQAKFFFSSSLFCFVIFAEFAVMLLLLPLLRQKWQFQSHHCRCCYHHDSVSSSLNNAQFYDLTKEINKLWIIPSQVKWNQIRQKQKKKNCQIIFQSKNNCKTKHWMYVEKINSWSKWLLEFQMTKKYGWHGNLIQQTIDIEAVCVSIVGFVRIQWIGISQQIQFSHSWKSPSISLCSFTSNRITCSSCSYVLLRADIPKMCANLKRWETTIAAIIIKELSVNYIYRVKFAYILLVLFICVY